MRREISFGLLGAVVLWLTSFLPHELQGTAAVIAVGLGVLGGLAARQAGDATGLMLGAALGTAVSGVTQSGLGGGPDIGRVVIGSAIVALIVGVPARLVQAVRATRNGHAVDARQRNPDNLTRD